MPTQVFSEDIKNYTCEKEVQYENSENDEAVQNILCEVDEVLGSIQQMLYQLPE